MSNPTMRSLIVLAVAAMAVVTLGMVTIYQTHASRTELLVGSTYVDPRNNGQNTHTRGFGNQAAPSLPASAGFYNQKDSHKEKLLVGSFPVNSRMKDAPHQPHGYGNQAQGSLPANAGYYNSQKDSHKEKLLVGSFPVDTRSSTHMHQPHGYGNQAQGTLPPNAGYYNQKDSHKEKLLVGSYNVGAGQKANPAFGIGNQASAGSHGVNDVGTNIVFHGVHNEGGVHGVKKQQSRKGLVGSTWINPHTNPSDQPHSPRGYGNQAAPSLPAQAGFYNSQKSEKQKLLVGSFPVDMRRTNAQHQPHGYGNQAQGSLPANAGYYNSQKDSHKEKLLVGSFPVDTRSSTHMHQPHGYGNQAQGTLPPNAGYYNQKDSHKEKLLVGSYNVGAGQKAQSGPAFGIGNQAAAGSHGVNDVGTNIVFHGVHNEGGVHGVKKQQSRKGLVGSTWINPHTNPSDQPHSPRGYGNQAAPSLPAQAGFYNSQKSEKQKLLVGSFPVDTRSSTHMHQPHGYGNQAQGTLPPNAGYYNQ